MGAVGTLLQTLRRVCLIRLPGGPNITISIVVSCEWNYSQRLQEGTLACERLIRPEDYALGENTQLAVFRFSEFIRDATCNVATEPSTTFREALPSSSGLSLAYF